MRIDDYQSSINKNWNNTLTDMKPKGKAALTRFTIIDDRKGYIGTAF